MSASLPQAIAPKSTTGAYLAAGAAFLCTLLGGLALIRLLYEALFPSALWLGRPAPALLLALMVGVAGWGGWRWLAERRGAAGALAPLLPLLLNAGALADPVVNLVRSRLFFAASVWLAAVLLYRLYRGTKEGSGWKGYTLFLVAGVTPIYLLTMGHTVGRADTFEFQVVVPRLGIAHPTGYPLYLLLSKGFTFLPVSTMAWRVNVASAVYAVSAVCLLYLVGWRLAQRTNPALLGAAAFALLPTLWSQAIEAEVYALHALVVAGALFVMARMLEGDREPSGKVPVLLALVLGLGLTNHLTTAVLLPAAGLALFFWHRARPDRSPLTNPRYLLKLAVAFLAPLLLYAYLPLRWAAVTGEPMGAARFIEWITGSRFQGALQLDAWLRDPARYEVVGRLLLSEWQPVALLLPALIGAAFLLIRRRRAGVILLVVWLGYVFYALNYYVPDLSVFLLPAHLVMAVWWGAGLAALIRLPASEKWRPLLAGVVLTVAAFALSGRAASTWPTVDGSQPDGRTQWGRGVLAMELPEGAAILADSEKYPPLYYLQQAEGLRPDLEIMVLPNEEAYRAEVAARLAAGQRVFLARLIPGLEGHYHLRSFGPLTEASRTALEEAPAGAEGADLAFGPVTLQGYELRKEATVDPEAAALTLYWQATEPVEDVMHVYVRWAGEDYEGQPIPPSGQHPANNTYPTVAWAPGEIVPDYHLLPRPGLNEDRELALQVALAPPFTQPEALSWQTVTALRVAAQQTLAGARPLRAQVGPTLLEGIEMAKQARPETALTPSVSGCGDAAGLQLALQPVEALNGERPLTGNGEALSAPACPGEEEAFVHSATVTTGEDAGPYALVARHPEGVARCGWLAPLSRGCVLGEATVSGVPLPEGATNFGDKIALLDVEVPETTLEPGGQLRVNLTWQALAPMEQDYTVFVQVVNAQDQIVGQVDQWPVQGTHPTSGWEPGEVVRDPYQVQLAETLPSGPYRLLVGLYRLDTLQRLPVLDKSGAAVDDKVVLPGLTAP